MRIADWSVLAPLLVSAILLACATGPKNPTQVGPPAAFGPCPPPSAEEVAALPSLEVPGLPESVSSDPGGNATPRVLVSLIERLERIDRAMQAIQQVPDIGTARRQARSVLDLIVGPGGRHASPTAESPGVLPPDRATLSDPGVAITVYGLSQDERIQDAMLGLLGELDRWQQPAARWVEIDAAVAAWTPTHNSMPKLDGRIMRVVGWALLALQTQTVDCAQAFGSHGAIQTSLSLYAARHALVVACTLPEARCT